MDEDVVLVERKESGVVSTSAEQFISVEVESSTVIVAETHSQVCVEDVETVVVAVGQQGPAGAGGAGIDDVTATLLTTFSGLHILELLNPFALTSFSMSPTVTEMGATVTSVTFNWNSNYAPDTASISGGVGAITLPATTKTATVSLTANTSFTLSLVRNGVTKTANASTSFLNRVYYGVNATQTLDPLVISAMTSVLSGSRSRSVTYDCTGGRYFHLAYPTRLGTASFQINNLTYSDTTLTVVSITNAFGFTENYNVHFCNVIQYGAAITLVVS